MPTQTRHRKPTLALIAERAGVSKSTACLALAGGDRVHPDTRNRIVALADELGYVPPRGRARKATKTIGVVLDRQWSWTGESFFTRIVAGVEQEAEAGDCGVVVATVDVASSDARRLPAFLEPAMVDGLVVVGITDVAFLGELESAGLPMVVVSGGEEGLLKSDYVVNDDFTGMRQVLMHLSGLGHTRIAMIGSRLHHFSNLQRLRAFRVFVEELGMTIDPTLIDVAGEDDTVSGGRDKVGALLDRGADFTALVCMTDELAFGALECLRQRGVSVPGQVSVVGYDDFQFAAQSEPPLTSVHINCEEMGEVAFQLLRNRLQGYSISHPLRAFVGPELVLRESTCAPRQKGNRILGAPHTPKTSHNGGTAGK